MVDSREHGPAAAGRTRRRAIPTRKTTKRAAAAPRKASRKRPASAPRRRKATRRRRTLAEQPLGMGADAFAVQRLMKHAPSRRPAGGVREIGWAEFGRLAGALAERIRAVYQPDVVLGVANAGVFVGGALAPALRAELVHLHLPDRGGALERLPSLSGKKVLVVDDAAESGRTLERAVALARKARAAEVRTAVIVLRPGGASPDYHAVETAEVTVFGWDYQFHSGAPDGDPGDAGV